MKISAIFPNVKENEKKMNGSAEPVATLLHSVVVAPFQLWSEPALVARLQRFT